MTAVTDTRSLQVSQTRVTTATSGARPTTARLPRRRRRRSPGRTARGLALHAVLVAGSLFMLAPPLMMIMTSLKTNAEVYQNPVGLPWHPTFDNYVETWHVGNFATLFGNSIFLTVVTMTLGTLIAALAAYGIVRSTSAISSVVYLILAIGIFLPMQLALIPQFRLVRELGLFNSYAGVILLYLASVIPFGTFLMASFMRQIPKEMREAATIDGAGYFRVFRSIYLPLARPAVATFWILQGVQIWNDFLTPLILMTDPERRTLTTGVMMFKQQYVADWGNVMAGVVIMSLPVIVLFILFQRHFTSGLYAGAVK